MTSLLMEMGKKNSSSRALLVIFLFSGVLLVTGVVLHCCLIHLPFRKKNNHFN